VTDPGAPPLLRRAARALWQHKPATAITALLLAGAVAGVASGSLDGARPGQAPAPAVAPAFTLQALTVPAGRAARGGRQVSLSQYAGRPVIVNFWASWCPPCQRETPLLASFYAASGGKVAIVGVDGNDIAAKAIAFVAGKAVRYPIGVDPSLATARAYRVDGFPQTFFLDSGHRIVDRVFGPLTQATLEAGVRLMTHAKLPARYIEE
jgi:cytochrome c biogenesis protein CcmG/thiol:disulfide interchange protein DsbE